MDKFPSELAERFQVRLPDGLREEIKASAERNNRSMNAEIVARIAGNTETLKDKFAAEALAGMIFSGHAFTVGAKGTAIAAYEFADAMVSARKAAV